MKVGLGVYMFIYNGGVRGQGEGGTTDKADVANPTEPPPPAPASLS